MKKFLAFTLIFMMVFVLAACGNNNISRQEGKADNQPRTTGVGQKILVVYFSHTGNTEAIAKQIHEIVGGDIFRIVTVDTYPAERNAVLAKAKQELQDNYRPKLAARVENINPYNVVFVGYPIWYGTMPTAVSAFLEGYDFSGKTIVPFCTFGGSGIGRSVDDIKNLCPKSTLLEALGIRARDVKTAQNSVSEWLQKIKIPK